MHLMHRMLAMLRFDLSTVKIFPNAKIATPYTPTQARPYPA